MEITIMIVGGVRPNLRSPVKSDMDANIAAIQRYLNGNPRPEDFELVVDTQEILKAIREQLPE